MTRATPSLGSEHQRIAMLSAQAFALGLTMAWVLIPASAIFLATYGSNLLPVTYIGAGIAGVASSKLLAYALRRRPLPSVAIATLGCTTVVLLGAWQLLQKANADWVAFALLVLIPIMVPVGFMFVVGQAGMLLDVRALKGLYARVVAGFALGFSLGGLAGPRLLAVLGGPANLLAAASLAAGMFLLIVVATQRRFHVAFALVEPDGAETEHATLRGLLRNRYVVLIVAFQMLSAVESQWLDFLVFDRAALRYGDSNALARFISHFTTLAYGSDIVFLVLLAGFLLRRFGLRYGLTANALGVLVFVAAMVAAASLRGSGATIVFAVIIGARVTDLVFSDAASRTSLSAAYQAMPAPLRTAAQAGVEGLAVPVAIGLSGAILLVVRAAGLLGGSVLPVLTSFVVLAWAVVAFRLYDEYRRNLLAGLRRRTLNPAELMIDGAEGLSVVDRLLESDEVRDVALGLDILATTRHPGLPAKLQPLMRHRRASVRVNALERLVELDEEAAVSAARDGLGDPVPKVRAACIRVLGGTGEITNDAAVAAAADPSPEVRVAVAGTLSRLDDERVRASVANEITRLSRSEVTAERVTAARMLAECAPGPWMHRGELLHLLSDPEAEVIEAALDAVRWPEDSELLAPVAARLHDGRTAGAALAALVRGGEASLDEVDRGLVLPRADRRVKELLARVGRDIGGPAAAVVLRRHVEHPDREVGLAVMRALAALGPQDSHSQLDEADPQEVTVVSADLEHATHALRAVLAFENEPSAELLRVALRDELSLVRQRVLAGMSMRHGTAGLNRVASQFAQRDDRSHALALEWLDVTLSGTERGVIAILDPGLSDRDRLGVLTRWFPLAPTSQRDLLVDLVEDRDNRWRRPWLRACALYTAAGMPDVVTDVLAAAESSVESSTDDEYDIVYETLVSMRRR